MNTFKVHQTFNEQIRRTTYKEGETVTDHLRRIVVLVVPK